MPWIVKSVVKPKTTTNLLLGLPKGPFPSGFPTKTLYAYLDCSIRATCPSHLSRLDLSFLIMLGEEYNACSSALCNFLHSPVILSLLAPNIFLSTLFPNILNLCPFLKLRDQVSQPYSTTGNIIGYIILNYHEFTNTKTMGGSPGDISEEPVT